MIDMISNATYPLSMNPDDFPNVGAVDAVIFLRYVYVICGFFTLNFLSEFAHQKFISGILDQGFMIDQLGKFYLFVLECKQDILLVRKVNIVALGNAAHLLLNGNREWLNTMDIEMLTEFIRSNQSDLRDCCYILLVFAMIPIFLLSLIALCCIFAENKFKAWRAKTKVE